MRVLKFLIAGVIGMSVNLGVFHLLYVLGVPYLIGSIAGVLVAMVIGFIFQKYWTFGDRASGRTHTQFVLYGALALTNLLLNTGIIYILIGTFGVYYLLAQAIGAAVTSTDSFIAYHFVIFRPHQGSGGSAEV